MPNIFYLFLTFILCLFLQFQEARAVSYTITNMKVEVESEQVKEARDKAIFLGQQQAFGQLVQSLLPALDPTKLPYPSTSELNRMIQSFEVKDEKFSSHHYRATLDVTFIPSQIDSFLVQHQLKNTATDSAAQNSSTPQQTLEVAVPINSLEEWVEIEKRLQRSATVQSIAISSISTKNATVTLGYQHTIPDVMLALKKEKLLLTSEQDRYVLRFSPKE